MEEPCPASPWNGGTIMQVKKIKDLPMWPPIWDCGSPGQPKEWVLKNVEVISGTKFLRIEVKHAHKTRMGVILTGADVLNILFRKLIENIGRPLAEIEDLEINF
jgi:hypothetical protein